MYCVIYILLLSNNAPVHSRAPVKVYGKTNVSTSACSSSVLQPMDSGSNFGVSLFKKHVS